MQTELFAPGIIRTVSKSQPTIIKSIVQLFCPNGFDWDWTYGLGGIWKSTGTSPRSRADLKPQVGGVLPMDVRNLPLQGESIKTSMFDPPFVAGGRGDSKIFKRYGSFEKPKILHEFYRASLKEIYRVTKKNGILAFKCQDFVKSRKNWFFHINIFNLAVSLGWYPKDLFILEAKSRAICYNMKKQNHARKYHCYYWIFKKSRADYNTWTN